MVQIRALMQGVPVRQAMITKFRVVTKDTPLAELVRELIAGEQQDFPVVESDEPVGLLTRNDLIAAIGENRQESTVGEVMRDWCGAVDEREMLQDTFLRMQQAKTSAIPVVRGEQLVGMITLENVGEWMMIQTALQQAKIRGSAGNALHVN